MPARRLTVRVWGCSWARCVAEGMWRRSVIGLENSLRDEEEWCGWGVGEAVMKATAVGESEVVVVAVVANEVSDMNVVSSSRFRVVSPAASAEGMSWGESRCWRRARECSRNSSSSISPSTWWKEACSIS